MTFIKLQKEFHDKLHRIFPKKEIDSFIYLLIDHKLGLKRIDLALNPNLSFSSSDQEYFSMALEKLKLQTPVQYIIGNTDFFGLIFNVDQSVLIPRPETEELVDWIIRDSYSRTTNFNILDIGTGSGCIAISLAKNLPNAQVWALDVSKNALNVAKINALENEVNINFICDDILNKPNYSFNFDIIVSNPPYVRELEKSQIKNNVLYYEPHKALFVKDADPLLFYNNILDFGKENLNPHGKIYFEINQYLGDEMIQLLKDHKFKKLELKKDLLENDRMLKGEL